MVAIGFETILSSHRANNSLFHFAQNLTKSKEPHPALHLVCLLPAVLAAMHAIWVLYGT